MSQLTKRIYYLEHDPELDRPMLAYLEDDRFSLAVDAGYSASHARDFYRAIEAEQLKIPDFTIATHWHYGHHAASLHSEDTVCINVLEEKALFLGDSASEDYFNGGSLGKEKLRSSVGVIQPTDCAYCILSHCEPLAKEELLCYLDGLF